MAVGVVVVIIIIAAALVLGSLIARRRQLQHARMAQVLGPEPVALEAVNTGGGTGTIRRPEAAHLSDETDILPAYEPAPEYVNPSKPHELEAAHAEPR